MYAIAGKTGYIILLKDQSKKSLPADIAFESRHIPIDIQLPESETFPEFPLRLVEVFHNFSHLVPQITELREDEFTIFLDEDDFIAGFQTHFFTEPGR
jgi:hypothetical protein